MPLVDEIEVFDNDDEDRDTEADLFDDMVEDMVVTEDVLETVERAELGREGGFLN